jgi:cbb3-type cytochrome oxidase subunit 1
MGVYFVIRIFFGVFVVSGFIIGLYNVIMTFIGRGKRQVTSKEVAAS